MNEARIGFVGCGSHATHNIHPMLPYSRGRLVAVCDLNRDAAERTARTYAVGRVFTDYREMFREVPMDGVMVVGPFGLHYEAGKAALEAGLNVFVEKAPAPSLAQAQELVNLAESKDRIFMTGFMKRHGLPYKKARELIQSGTFMPMSACMKYGHWKMGDNRHGMMLTMSSHLIDLALSFFGEAESLSWQSRGVADYISLGLTITFRSGVWAHLWLDGSQPRIQERVEISGQMGTGNALIVVDNVQNMELHKEGHWGIDLLAPTAAEINPVFDLQDIQMWRPDYGIPNMGQSRSFIQGFAGEVREFVDAIIEKRQPYPSTRDSVKAMQIIDIVGRAPKGEAQL